MGSFRKVWDDREVNNSCLDKFCWQVICPPKVEIFVWQLLKGGVMVKQVIQRFGLSTGSNPLCPMCNNEEESVNHLFIHCRWA